MRLLGLSGSLRKASFNTGLLRAAVELVPDGVVLQAETLHGVPLYDADLEATEGVPPAVAALKTALGAADGLLMVTPEYNSGVPGVFKNAIDWMSRPPGGLALFKGKRVAVIGASAGGFGTISAQDHWLPVMKKLGAEVWAGGSLLASRSGDLFDAEGQLTDGPTRKRLAEFLAGFAASLKS